MSPDINEILEEIWRWCVVNKAPLVTTVVSMVVCLILLMGMPGGFIMFSLAQPFIKLIWRVDSAEDSLAADSVWPIALGITFLCVCSIMPFHFLVKKYFPLLGSLIHIGIVFTLIILFGIVLSILIYPFAPKR